MCLNFSLTNNALHDQLLEVTISTTTTFFIETGAGTFVVIHGPTTTTHLDRGEAIKHIRRLAEEENELRLVYPSAKEHAFLVVPGIPGDERLCWDVYQPGDNDGTGTIAVANSTEGMLKKIVVDRCREWR